MPGNSSKGDPIRVKSIIRYIKPDLTMGIRFFANRIMNIILSILNFLAILSTLITTIFMILIFRSVRPVNHLSPLLSILVCLQILFFFMILSGSRLNLWLSGFLLLTGSMIGLIRGLIIKLHYINGQVVGKMPLFFLLGWGGALAFVQILNTPGSILLSSFGLMPLIFTTGTQVGISTGLFLRRLFIRTPNTTLPI